MSSDFTRPVQANSRVEHSSTLDEIERLLEQLVEFVASAKTEIELGTELLGRAVIAVGARGGIVWRSNKNEVDSPIVIQGLPASRSSDKDQQLHSPPVSPSPPSLFGPWQVDHARIDKDSPLTLPGRLPAHQGDQDVLRLACPIVIDEATPAAILEVWLPSELTPQGVNAAGEVISVFARSAAPWFQRQQLREIRQQLAILSRWNHFLLSSHSSLDVESVAYHIVNNARSLVRCDRLTLIILRNGKPRTIAMSGQSVIDRRSEIVRAYEELARPLIASGLGIGGSRATDSVGTSSVSGDSDRPVVLPPEISSRLEKARDASSARTIYAFPLGTLNLRQEAEQSQGGLEEDVGDSLFSNARVPETQNSRIDRCFGVLLVEYWSAYDDEEEQCKRCEELALHSENALRNAISHQDLPFLFLTSRMRRFTTPKRWTTLLLTALLVVVGCTLWFVEGELQVTGQGTLQPEHRREVFAPVDGVVDSISIKQHQQCDVGDVLFRLSRSALDLETTRVQSELQTARKKLAGLRVARLQSDPQSALDREKFNERAAEEAELDVAVSGLERQLGILERQADELIVRAPMSGEVLTWDVAELLQSRPVERGQILVTMGDLNGPWTIDIEIPDDQIGYVQRALEARHGPLTVRFVLATAPESSYEGILESIALSSEPSREFGAMVRAVVRVPETAPFQRRPGAAVIPRIQCGRFPLGYVWFHAAWDGVQRALFQMSFSRVSE